MSTKLQVSLEPSRSSDPSEAGAVGRVIRNDTGTETSIIIPVGPSSTIDDLVLEPGRYTIEARLPSGALVRQQAEVKENQPSLSVRFKSDEIDPSEGLKSPGSSPVEVSVLSVSRMRAECWINLANLVRRSTAPDLADIEATLGATRRAAPPSRYTQRNASYVWHDGASQDYNVLEIAAIERKGVVELVPLPIPWRTRTGTNAAVEVTVPFDAQLPLRATVHDPDFGIVMRYLGAGAVVDAQTLLASRSPAAALEMLKDKLENPFAASLGASALVLAETTGAPQRWDPWIDRLASAFSHLPDAAVVHATRLLRRASPEPGGALHSLTRASRMGIPIFAPVAKLFLDGLTTLIFDPDFESGALDEKLYKAVRIVMMRVVPGQALTIVRLENRKHA